MTNKAASTVSEFLFDAALVERIRHVAGGSDVCCAVAFWSEDGIARVFEDAKAAKRAHRVRYLNGIDIRGRA